MQVSKDMIKKSKSINFLREIEFGSQLFGKLILFMPDDIVLDLSVILLKMELCVQTEKYLNELFYANDNNSSNSAIECSNLDDIIEKSQKVQCPSYNKR